MGRHNTTHMVCCNFLATPCVLSAPASLIGSEFPQSTWLRPFALPHPDALIPLWRSLSSSAPPGPIGGDWSELCIASGTFRETMGRRTGVSALRNPGGAQPDVNLGGGRRVGYFVLTFHRVSKTSSLPRFYRSLLAQ